MKRLLYLLTIAMVAMLLCGCKGTQQIVERPVYIHDTTQAVLVQKDSVFVHDSIYLYKNGDSVYISQTITRYITQLKHDTIREMQEVPVEVVRTETIEVEKPPTWWQKFYMKGFWWLAVGLMGYMLWCTRKWWSKLIRL